MHIIQQPRTRYRLVVRMPGREIVGENLVFERYKEALAHVAPAVRDHSNGVVPHAIVLQRATDVVDLTLVAAAEPLNGEDDGAWEEVERWGVPVIQRILAQHTRRFQSPPTLPATPTHLPRRPVAVRPTPKPQPVVVRPNPTPIPAAAPVIAPQPATVPAAVETPADTAASQPRVERQSLSFAASRRASIFVGVLVVVGVWLGLLALISGGRIQALLETSPSSQVAATQEIHVDGPAAVASDAVDAEN